MGKRKFYAVFNRETKKAVIHDTWDEAKKVILGLNVAQKSFGSIRDAEDFISNQKRIHGVDAADAEPETKKIKVGMSFMGGTVSKTIRNPDVLHVYTDGSHIKGTDKRGAGGVVFYKNNQFRFSIDPEKIRLVVPVEASNPTMELLAATHVLNRLNTVFEGKEKPQLMLFADYVGVLRYINKEWKPKPPKKDAPGVNEFREQARKLVAATDLWKGKIVAKHVKGHSNNMGNDIADQMAGCGEALDHLDRIKNFF